MNNSEIYKIVNEKINKEVDEFYQINVLFSAAQTIGIFSYLDFQDKKLSIISLLVMVTISILWWRINEKAYAWREYWLNIAKELEVNFTNDNVQKVWTNTSKVTYLHGTWKMISFLPLVFLIAWLAFIYFQISSN